MTEVIFTDEFDEWYLSNSREIRKKLFMVIGLLKELGTVLPFPYTAKILGAKYNLRELRKEISGKKYRIIYVFDPERKAVLLLGGDKTGDKDWYEKNIRNAEKIYDKYLSLRSGQTVKEAAECAPTKKR